MGSFYQNGIVANLHDFSYGTSSKGNYTKLENDLMPGNFIFYQIDDNNFSQIEISKLILENDKIDIKPSMIQPFQEIKALGKHKVKIYLHSVVDAEIIIEVQSAETIQ